MFFFTNFPTEKDSGKEISQAKAGDNRRVFQLVTGKSPIDTALLGVAYRSA